MRPGRDPESADTPTTRESLDLLLTTAIIDGSDHSYEAFGANGPATVRTRTIRGCRPVGTTPL